MKNDRSRVLLALGSLYVIWGSTFLAIRIALQGYPPLLLAGLRFVIAGAVTYAWARARGAPPPMRTEWRSSLIVGTLLVCANACVVIAEQWVSSGVAAVAIASVPLWVALFAGLFGRWPSQGEWVGLAVGLAGVALLQTGGDLRATPAGAAVLTVSCASGRRASGCSARLRASSAKRAGTSACSASERARAGSSWTSTIRPSAPADHAALASPSTRSARPAAC